MLWVCLHIAIFFWFSSMVFILLNYDKIKVSSYYIKLLMLISIIMILLPPLPAFAIYFCLIHSAHHVKRIVPTLLNFMEKQKAIFLMIIFSLFSWLGCGIGFYFLTNLNSYPDSIIKVTFIGLAALTFPHMILVDGIFRSKFEI